MKKIFYLASIAALALSSCAKDQTTEAQIDAVNGGAKITAAMAADDTRTSLEKVDGKYEFRWSAGDQLGVYGVGGGLNNAAFVLNNNSDGQAVGVFSSQNTELKADKSYVAVYPRFQTSLFSAADITAVKWDNPADPTPSNTDDDIWYPNYEAVKVNIPAVQKYQPETFYTQTVPAVSTTFTVGNDGAEVSMQPVVDYLFVNIKSTEPIKTLTLGLSNPSTSYDIAGKGELTKYILNGEYRYMLNQISEDNSQYITLEMDEASAAVTCHSANTYVFAVPAGILGMNNGVRAYLYVNKTSFGDNWDFAVAEYTLEGKQMVTNAQLNYYVDNKGTATTSDDVLVSRKHATTSGKYISRLENTVFWANPLEKGVRTTFEYNPNNDYIIEHEGQLLKYLTEYNKGTIGLRDAFICSEHVFDFSLQHMMELTTELKEDGTYSEFQTYISNYLADNGTFPCIANYVNEFKGNGAVIENIARPLAGNMGIFGNIKPSKNNANLIGKVSDITFSGIVAYNEVDVNYAQNAYVYIPGYILGNIEGAGSISNVTVDNAQGRAILKSGDVADYKNLTVTNADGLEYVIFDMNLNDNLAPANWDAVKAVKTTVFNSVDADGHKVVTLPAGADYADLASYVSTGLDYDTIYDDYVAKLKGTPSNAHSYSSKAANQTDNNVVSVLIGEDSYWTGDKTNWSMDLPKKVSSGDYKGYYKLEYAEQLAMGADANNSARVMRNMHLESAVNAWKMVTVQHLDGNNKTISGVYMDGTGLETVAPVDAEVLTNLTVDGVTLDLKTKIDNGTTYTVPTTISGLAVDAKTITNVTVNNLVIDAYAFDGTNNTEAYYGNTTSIIGWMVAKGTDTYITDSKVNGVNSNVRGLAGLVGEMTLVEGAQINNSAATNVTKAQADITDFAQFKASSHKNLAGTAVAVVKNAQSNPKDIKFVGIGKPAFLYDSAKGITVVYDSVESKTWKNR